MTFAAKLRAALGAAKAAAGDGWNAERWDAVVNATAADEGIARKRKPKGAARARNPLFDALATATGTKDLSQLTRNAAKAIGVALADILDVCPDLTVDEIERRANAYRRRWPDPRNLSAQALAKHWASVGGGEPTRPAKTDIYTEPPGDWRAIMRGLYPGAPILEGLAEAKWSDLPSDARKAVLKEVYRE